MIPTRHIILEVTVVSTLSASAFDRIGIGCDVAPRNETLSKPSADVTVRDLAVSLLGKEERS